MDYSVEELVAGDVMPAAMLRRLLSLSEELGSFGIWAWDTDGDTVAWSDSMYRLLGLEREAVPADAFASAVHHDDCERLTRGFDRWRRDASVTHRYRVIRPDGEVRWWESVGFVAVERGSKPILTGCTRDFTDKVLVEREIKARAAVSEALSRWQSVAVSAEDLLSHLGAALGMERGVLWTRGSSCIVARALWTARPPGRLLAQVAELRLGLGEGFAGRTWETGEPLCVADLRRETGYAFAGPAEEAGLRSAIAIPAVKGGKTFAALGFATGVPLAVTDHLHATLRAISRELGEFFSHRRADLEPPRLTAREREILQLAAHGCMGPEIARRLYLSTATVKSHFENIYAKYGVRDRSAAVAQALREGLIT
jgi:PAS domain S-box-containing protein